MAYTIETEDGITIEGIPDDVKPDSQALKDRVAKIRAEKAAGGKITGQIEEGAPAQSFDMGKQIAGDLGAVGRGVAGGLASLPSMVMDPVTQLINTVLPKEWQQLPPSQGIQTWLTSLGVPPESAQTEAQKILQATTQGLSGASAMVGGGKALAQGAQGMVKGVGEALAAQPVQQLAGAGAAGAASAEAGNLGWDPLAQAGAGVLGGVAGAGLAGLKAVPTGRTPELIDEANRAGVKLMTSDVLPPNTFASKWLQATAEKIPLVGTGGLRRTQQDERVDAVRNLLRDFGADDASSASDDVMKDLAGKRSADMDKWVKTKSQVIEGIPSATPVPTPSTVKAIDDQIAKLESLKTKEVAPVIDRLKDWKESIQGQSLQNVETLRKQIGESFKAPELASVRSTGEKALSSIYGALKEDMGSFIKANGGKDDYTKWMVANKQLSDMAGELKNNALASVLKRGDATPEVINKMLFSAKPSEVTALYRNLTESGQANARAAILAKAAEKAGEGLSPDKFANEVKRLGTSVGVFFGDDDLKQVNGLIRVLDATKRAGQASVAPPTGVQAVLPTGAAALASFYGGGLPGFLGTMGTAAGVGGAARLYESKGVRDLLMKIPMTIKGSPEEAALFKRLATTIQQNPDAINSASDKAREYQQSQGAQ